MSSVSRFLSGLDEQLKRTLPPDEAESIVAEARDHLENSIQARMELGATREEAERGALAAFGEARRVREEVRRREPRFDPGFALTVLAMAAFVLWAVNQRAMGRAWFLWLGLYAVLHGAFAVKSFRVRRPQLLIFAVVLLPLWLGNAADRSMRELTVSFPDSTGGSTVVRAESAQRIRQYEASAAKFEARSKDLLAAYTRYVKGESDLALRRGSLYDSRGNLRLSSQPNRTLGEAEWNRWLGLILRTNSLTGQRQWERARLIEAAAGRSWLAEMPYQLGPALDRTGVLQILGMYGGGHVLLWAIGARARRGPSATEAFMSSVSRFLEAFAAEAAKSLSPSEVRAAVEEMRAHLEESIAGRLELGWDPDEAERTAIQELGEARTIGKALGHDEAAARRWFLSGAIGLILFLGGLTGVSLNPFWISVSVVAYLGFHVAFVVGSFRGRRPQILSLVLLFVGTMGVSSLVASRTHATALTQGVALHYRRAEISGQIQNTQGYIESQRRNLQRFKSDYSKFLRGESTDDVPGVRMRPSDTAFNRFAHDALLKRIAVASMDLGRNTSTLVSLREAAARPWWEELPYAPGTVFQEVWPGFVGYTLIHLFAWLFGVVWRARPRRDRSAYV